MNVLDIVNLNISFPTKAGVVQASDGVTLKIRRGEVLCLVGESGCGKTMVALSIMGLLPGKALIDGKILFNDKNLFSLQEKEMRRVRGRDIAMIFEQPARCLNPVLSVGDQIAEAIRSHEKCSRKASRQRAVDMMGLVGIPSPRSRYGQYPHEFSGGMAQRVMIAMALVFRPCLLIADEPTTSLDVTIQAQIIHLLKGFVAQFNTSLLLITHDLGVAAQIGDRIAVMYAGGIVEKGRLVDVFKTPRHPYTRALVKVASSEDLAPVNGAVPELSRLPSGCRFHPRCSLARDLCSKRRPKMQGGVSCHLLGSTELEAEK
jgi:oligopeptide/dipeptide ABC transporter ATP-binding protein